MSFYEQVRRATEILREHGRTTLRALGRELDLDGEGLEDLVNELVEARGVAERDGNLLLWVDGASRQGATSTRLPTTPAPPERLPSAYTPPHLAEKILRSRSALEGERKLVTVLFADVKGSMDLAVGLDAEEWHGILDRFFTILTDGVHRFEGTVNQYTGDGIMALFGAPIAHEDHAQRACYAALALRDALRDLARDVKRRHGIDFATRIGINSGEVVVGKIGDDLRMDYTAQGHTVGLAQRMESLASGGSIYLSEHTAKLTGLYFELEDLGEFTIKGVPDPTHVFELKGAGTVSTRFDVSRARGLTRFVGRDADMETLDVALAHAQAGNGQVVGVVAEAGTGKSRLCFEFLERLKARGITVNQGAAVSHGKNVPYLPMLQVFRGYFGITDTDDDRAARQKIAGRMLMLGEEYREELPLLFDFFGVPDPRDPASQVDPDAARRRLFAILRKVVQGADPTVAAERFVTLIEDLHWLDEGSEAFVAEWVDALAGSSSFLLVNFRPEYRAEWMQNPWYRQIPLAPLGPEAIRELIGNLIGSDPSTDGLADSIHARTGGNPFFAEEVVQTLIEAGQLEGSRGAFRLTTSIEELKVPASVRALLASRIDRLPEREKELLQAASVIGREFTEPILLAVAGLPESDARDALAVLRRAELVYEEALFPVAEYAFKHALTQEVALGSQLRERRRTTHAAVADAIEKLNPAKLDEVAAVIAHHHEEADQTLEAARWHYRAGVRAARNDAAGAARHFEKVRSLTNDTAPSPERDAIHLQGCLGFLSVGWRVGVAPEKAEEVFREGCDLAARGGNVTAALGLRFSYAGIVGLGGDLRRQLAIAQEAARLVDDSVAPESVASVCFGVSYPFFVCGRLADAEEALDRAITLAGAAPTISGATFGIDVWGVARDHRARLAAYRGNVPEAFDRFRSTIRELRAHRLIESLGWALGDFLEVAHFAGECGPGALDGTARRMAAEVMKIATQIGSPQSLAPSRRALGIVHQMHGDFDAATTAYREALDAARSTATALERESHYLALLSEGLVWAGDIAEARSVAEEGARRARDRGAGIDEIHCQLVLARALREVVPVDSGASERALNRARDLVQETDARIFEPQVIEEQARFAALRGDDAAAGLARALDFYRDIGATGHADRLARELEESPP